MGGGIAPEVPPQATEFGQWKPVDFNRSIGQPTAPNDQHPAGVTASAVEAVAERATDIATQTIKGSMNRPN